MRAFVYSDASLERYAGRFVWLSINTEVAANAAFLKRYPVPSLPTLFVIDAKRDAVALRYFGVTTLPKLRKLLEEGEATYRNRAISAADAALVKADRLSSVAKHAEAAAAYDEAIAAAPRSWNKLERASELLLYSLTMSDAVEPCVSRAFALYPRLKGTVAGARVAVMGLGCAMYLKEDQPKRAAWLSALGKGVRESFDDPKIVMADDDRSSLFQVLVWMSDGSGDKEGATKLRAQWAQFLESAAARAKTAEQRAVFDSHRLIVYRELGTPEKAIPMLEQSERDLPDDYNPPARLAIAWKAMKEYDKALAASDRALARAYGARKIGIYTQRSDIYKEKGDLDAARATLRDAIEFAKTLPEGQGRERVEELEKTLAALEKAAP
jgi:tetratricopeptide (TPR) repeat protein